MTTLEQWPIYAVNGFANAVLVPTSANDGTMWTDGSLDTYAQLTAPITGQTGVVEAGFKAVTIEPVEIWLRIVASYTLLEANTRPQRLVWNLRSYADEFWQLGGSFYMSTPGPNETRISLADFSDPDHYVAGAMINGWDAQRFATDLAGEFLYLECFNNAIPGRSVMQVSTLSLEFDDAPPLVITGRPDLVRRRFIP